MALKNPFVETIEIRPGSGEMVYRLECDQSEYSVPEVYTLAEAREAVIMLMEEEQVQINAVTEITVSYSDDNGKKETQVYPVALQELMNLNEEQKQLQSGTAVQTEKPLKRMKREELMDVIREQTRLLDQKETESRLRELELTRQIRALQDKLKKALDSVEKLSQTPGEQPA